MAEVTIIGRGTHIRGRVTGDLDIEVQGQVDGEIEIDGDLTVDARGRVGASISARKLVVRGAVRGDLTGSDAVLLEEGARVLGDVRAPRIAIAPGALVRGLVQTGSAKSPPRTDARGSSRQAAKPQAAPVAARSAPLPSRPAVKENKAPAARAMSSGSMAEAPKGPPAPVVPTLKKGAKAALKKRA